MLFFHRYVYDNNTIYDFVVMMDDICTLQESVGFVNLDLLIIYFLIHFL